MHGTDVSILNCRASKGTGTFLYLKDVKDKRQFTGNDLIEARRSTEPSRPGFMVMSGNLPAHGASRNARRQK